MHQSGDIESPNHGPNATIVVAPWPVERTVFEKIVPTGSIRIDGYIDRFERVGVVHPDSVQIIEDDMGPLRVRQAAQHGQ